MNTYVKRTLKAAFVNNSFRIKCRRVFVANCHHNSTDDCYEVPRVHPSPNDELKDFNLTTHILKPWADKQPNKTALWLTDGKTTTKVTYSKLLLQSQHLASSLGHSDLEPPRCGLVILPKIAPWWIINLAGSLCEMAVSPGASMLAERDITYRLKQSEADAIFCDSDVMERIDKSTIHIKWRILAEDSKEMELKNIRDGWLSYHELVEKGASLEPFTKEYNGESVAQLFFTSGTTGYPKMVPHTQREYGLGHVPTARDWLNLRPSDISWNISDLGWAKAAYSSLYAPLISGSTMFVHQMPRFDAKVVLETLENVPISVLCLPPTALRSIVQEDLSSFKPKCLKLVASAGEPLNPEISKIWYTNTGLVIKEGYGQTEMTLAVSSTTDVVTKPGSIGKPVKGYDIKILDENLDELGPNEEGQIAISLKNGWPVGLFRGYRNKEQNDKAFVSDYFLTGDKAIIDDEGYVWYVGRADDMIISAGYRIGPYEVESALIEHPAVAESAVVASPDYYRGHVVKAFIILKEDFKTKIKTDEGMEKLVQEIQKFVKATIAPYKYPRKIEFVEELPKTISGKIRRVELRKLEEEQARKENKPQ